jgi:hypothetical protein
VLTIAPAPRVLDHRRGICRHPVAVKGGLYQPPLPTVRFPLSAEETLTGEALGGLESHSGKAAVVGHQDISDVVRVVQEIEMLTAKSAVDDVTVLLRDTRQEAE